MNFALHFICIFFPCIWIIAILPHKYLLFQWDQIPHLTVPHMKKFSTKADEKGLAKSGPTGANVPSSDHPHVSQHSVVSYYKEVRTREFSLSRFWWVIFLSEESALPTFHFWLTAAVNGGAYNFQRAHTNTLFRTSSSAFTTSFSIKYILFSSKSWFLALASSSGLDCSHRNIKSVHVFLK